MNHAAIPVIVIITYIIGEIYKIIFKTDAAKRLIPILAVISGAVLGAVIYFTAPEVISVTNAWDAILVGCVSGASATGANQIIKQLFGGKND